MKLYKQTPFGQHTQQELRDIYWELSDETRAIIDARAYQLSASMNERGQKFGPDMALELLLAVVAYTERPELAIPVKNG